MLKSVRPMPQLAISQFSTLLLLLLSVHDRSGAQDTKDTWRSEDNHDDISGAQLQGAREVRGNRDDISGAQPQGAREVRGQSWRVGLPPLHGF